MKMLNEQELYKIVNILSGVRQMDSNDLIKMSWDEFLLYCKLLNPQSYGSNIEKKFIKDNHLRKNKSTDNNGDFNYNGADYELKSSYLSKDNHYSLVQIRP